MQRMTKQRQAVFEELQRVDDFRCAQQIFEHLTAQGHKVGLATVYRNLQALAEAGNVDIVRSDEGESLFRLCRTAEHHHHLVCRSCGSTREIEQSDIEQWVGRIATQFGFTAVEHHMELFGLCALCSADSKLRERYTVSHRHSHDKDEVNE